MCYVCLRTGEFAQSSTVAHTKRTVCIYPCFMASKGQPTQDDCEAGPSGLIHEEEDKREEDELRGPPGTSVQQNVKEK